MNNVSIKKAYQKAADRVKGWGGEEVYIDNEKFLISDLLKNAITNIEIIEQYFHSVDPLISKRCQNCGQKLRVKVNN